MAQSRDAVPEEILYMRRWLGEVFTQASRDLPWPQQASLRLVEQGLALGMFGGLLSSAWLLQEFRGRAADPSRSPDLTRIVNALQEAAIGPLPGPFMDALRLVATNLPAGAGAFELVQNLLERSFPAKR